MAAALAIFGQPGAALQLHNALAGKHGLPDSRDPRNRADPIDVIQLKPHLKQAIIDGFAATGDEGAPFGEAWIPELDGLDLFARPVVRESSLVA